MLLTTHIQVTIYSSEIKKYYTKLGYVCKIHEKILVKINHIKSVVRETVKVKCDYCGQIKNIRYSKYIRNTKNGTRKFSCSNACGRLKSSEFLMENFGVKNVSQIASIKEKKKNKAQKIYGVDNISQSKLIQNKVKQTKKEKYGDKNYVNVKKTKETLLKKYGESNYGAFGSVSYNKKIKDKYGDVNPSCTPTAKQKKKTTSIKNYGTDNPSKTDSVKEKIAKTNMERYGVIAPLQNLKIFELNQKNAFKLKLHENLNLYYRGTYEKDFLDYCYNNKIQISKGISIPYNYEEKNRIYHSDFYLKEENLIIEIKSKYYYEKYLQKNLAKQSACLKQGYTFIFIINKNYEEFAKLLN